MFRFSNPIPLVPTSLIRFLAVGVANTMVGLSVIWIAKEIAGAGDVVANIAGYGVGVTVSFILNKRWSFSFRGDGGAAFLRFLVVFGVAYTANLITVFAAIALSGQHSFWCQVCGAFPYTTLFYLGCRWYAFPRSSVQLGRMGSAGE